jgi:hypothetical protein
MVEKLATQGRETGNTGYTGRRKQKQKHYTFALHPGLIHYDNNLSLIFIKFHILCPNLAPPIGTSTLFV